jgi:hypothetical protein
LISQDPYFRPSDEALETAELLMRCYADRDDIWSSDRDDYYELWDKPAFIQAYYLYDESTQTCPACGQPIDSNYENEDGTTWQENFERQVYDAEDAAQVKVMMPCCHQEIVASDIDFTNKEGFSRVQAGFSRFQVYAGHTNYLYHGLSQKQLLGFERILGCKLKQIIAVF